VVEAADDHGGDERPFWLGEDETHLITGGLGGLGLLTARWLADHGARNLVLVGRSGVSEEAKPILEELKQGGVRVEVRSCDVSDREEVSCLLDGIRAELPPLKGIFHLAGVLDDGILREQTPERFDRVMAAKAMGAWHLHDLTRDDALDLFVLFSSAAALLGSPGQANYAAANAFLDALAHQRRWEKRPALSVNWGSWAEVGMAARLRDSEGKRWSASGIGWIEPQRGLETLEQLIVAGCDQAGVLPIDWPKFFSRIPAGTEPTWLLEVAEEARAAGTAGDSGPPVLLEKLQEATPSERIEVALTELQRQASRVLAMEKGDLPDPRRPLNELGFDSLTAVEFCNRVGRLIGQHINPTLLFDYPTLDSLTGYIVRDVLQLASDAAESPDQTEPDEVSDADRMQTASEVQEMSDEQINALVAKELEELQQ
jgi:NAD(P)-dependent dehydrogenase (short-subunit alcohol dehydrogenase family)/acyl carrier protein